VTPPTGWHYLLPEYWLIGLIFVLIGLDLRWKDQKHSRLGLCAAWGLLPVFGFIAWQWRAAAGDVLGGMYRVDTLAVFFKGLFAASALATILMTRELSRTLERGQDEFYLLILTAALGMFFTASSANFLMLFVSLELMAITFYVLTAYLHTHSSSLEAGMKYLVLGSLSSGLLLYGIAYVYGTTGSMQFLQIQQALQNAHPIPPALLFGLLMVTAGICFKMAAVPFQVWVPDVYQGAPTPITAFLSVGSKAAGFIVALRVFYEVFRFQADVWSPILAVLAGLTILYGNLGAIPQTHIKRFLGYSSIGHAGYLLIGVAAGSALGAAAVNYYLLSYLFTNLAAFLVVTEFSRATGSDEMADYAGLSKRSPFLAAAMFIALLSLAGVPPLAGFMGKFLLLMAALREGFFWLAIIGGAAVVISLYYYLSLVKKMYADPPANPTPIEVRPVMRLAILICLAAMLVIGIYQAPFLSLCLSSVRTLL